MNPYLNLLFNFLEAVIKCFIAGFIFALIAPEIKKAWVKQKKMENRLHSRSSHPSILHSFYRINTMNIKHKSLVFLITCLFLGNLEARQYDESFLVEIIDSGDLDAIHAFFLSHDGYVKKNQTPHRVCRGLTRKG